MKITINKKMDKSVAARGRIVKLLIPRAGMTYFKVGNAVLDKLLTGRKLKKYFTDEVYIERGDGTTIRTLLYSRRGVKEAEEFTSKHPDAGSKIAVERKRAESAKIKSENATATESKTNKSSRPAFLWIHGGGYAMGIPEQEFYFTNRILEAIDAVVISPEYTRSVDAPYPKALEDCYCALRWLKENAEDLGADPDRIFVGGDSAGGGLTAAISLYARDKGEVNIAYQMPLYPMLDDRPTRSNVDNKTPCWDSQSNDKAWKLYLGDLYGTDKVPYYAAPARAEDLAGLPPTLTYVGDIEPFYAETVDYVERLRKAGVPTEFRVYPGCYHGFDVICPDTEPGKDAIEFFRNGLIHAAENLVAKQKN